LSARNAARLCEVPFRVKIIAIIMEPSETAGILNHLVKIGREMKKNALFYGFLGLHDR
jgi:hypothetical protein